MKDNISGFTLRINRILLDKLAYIADFEVRSKNNVIERLIRKKQLSLKSKTVR